MKRFAAIDNGHESPWQSPGRLAHFCARLPNKAIQSRREKR
jgi:hypothetical protein